MLSEDGGSRMKGEKVAKAIQWFSASRLNQPSQPAVYALCQVFYRKILIARFLFFASAIIGRYAVLRTYRNAA
jgi:hypothetical protein